MSTLQFAVKADFEKVVKLKEEIANLKNELKGLGKDASADAVKKLEQRLGECEKEMGALVKKAAVAGDAVKSEASGMEDAMKKVGAAVAAAFTVNAIKDFIVKVGEVRGEYQKLGIAFSTILGSKQSADSLMAELAKTAAITPFSFKDVTDGAKQLLAFGIEADKVNDTLVRLGDIAAGTGAQVGQLTNVYGQIKAAGKMNGGDLLQFINAGVPIIKALASAMGVAENKVKDLISEGKVGFPEVDKAIKSLTDSGSMFGGMMEEQAKTITGRVSSIKDALEQIINQIGEQSEGAFSGALDVAEALVANYELVGKAIVGLIGTYGAYKAAVIAVSAIESIRYQATLAHMAGMTKMQAVTDILKTKTEALNAALFKNPYALLATAIVGASTALAIYITRQTEVTKITKAFSDTMEDAERNANKERMKLAELRGQLDATRKGTDEYKKIKDEIISQFGQYDDNLATEIEKVGFTADAYDRLSESILKSARARGYDTAMKAQNDMLDDTMSKELGEIYKDLVEKYGREDAAKYQKKLIDAMSSAKVITETSTTYGGSSTTGGGNYQQTHSTDRVRFIGKEKQELADLLNSNKGVYDSYLRILKTQDTVNKNAETIRKTLGLTTEDLAKAHEENNPETTPSTSDKTKTKAELAAERAAARKAAAEEKQLSDQRAERMKQEAQAKDRQIAENRKNILAIEDAKIANMEEGFAKELAVIKQNRAKLREANKEREEQMLADRADELTRKYVDENPTVSKEQQVTYRLALTDPENKDRLTRDNLAPAQKWALEAYDNEADKTEEKEKKDLYKRLGEAYADFGAQRTATDKKYNDDKKVLEESSLEDLHMTEEERQAAIDELERQRKESIKRISDAEVEAMMKTSSLMVDLFGDASDMSTRQIQKVVDKTKAMLDYIKNTKPEDMDTEVLKGFGISSTKEAETLAQSPEKIKAITEQIEKMQQVASKSNPFKALGDALHDVFDKNGKDNKKDPEVKLKKIGKAAAETADFIGGVAGQLSEMFAAGGNTEMADMFSAVQDTMGAVSNIGKGFAEGGIFGGIAAAAGEAINLVGKAFAASARHAEALKQIMREMTAQQQAYTLALLESKLAAEDLETIFGTDKWGKAKRAVEAMRDSQNELTQAIRGTEEEQNQVIANTKRQFADAHGTAGEMMAAWGDWSKVDTSNAGLRSIEIKTGHKKTGLFGWGKGKDTYSSILDVYPQLIKANGEFDAELAKTIIDTREFNGEGKEALQNMINLYEEHEKALESLRSYFTDIFGELGNNISNALVDAFKNGTDAAQAFTKSTTAMLEKLGEQMVYSVTLAPLFEEAQKEMEEITKNGSLTSAEKFSKYTDVIDRLTDDVADQQDLTMQLMEHYQEKAREKGFEIWNSNAEQEASKAVSTSMTQDQASEISGRLTAGVEAVYQSNGIAQQKLGLMTEISGSITVLSATNDNIRNIADDMRDIIAQSYLELQSIRENTEAVVVPVRNMARDINKIVYDGIKVK